MVDSSCDLPPECIQEQGIEVMPMPFYLDGIAHDQGNWQEITDKEYYEALRKGSIAKTSQISPGSFVAVFTEYAKQNKGLILITLGSGLSATYQSAEMVLREIKASYPDCNIHLIDSLNATAGHGLLAMLAVQKRAEGMSVGDVAAWLENKKHSCFSFFTVDDLMYLHRGGRLSKLSAVAGSVLGVKPVLNIAPDGTLKLKDKVRGRQVALKTLISQFQRSLNPGTVPSTALISHSDCLDDAQVLAEMVKTLGVRNISIMMMGPVIGAHVGPGAITLIFEADMTREEYDIKFYGKT